MLSGKRHALAARQAGCCRIAERRQESGFGFGDHAGEQCAFGFAGFENRVFEIGHGGRCGVKGDDYQIRGDDAVCEDTVKLIRLVEDTEKNQAPSQRIADRWASWLVPVSLLIAIATYILTGDIIRAVTVIVVFCPCALALATPTAIMAAIGQATKHGVIIKSGDALEKMGQADTIAFDKTGTLTCGKLEVSDIVPVSAIDAEEKYKEEILMKLDTIEHQTKNK